MWRWVVRIGLLVVVVAGIWVARLVLFAPQPVSVEVFRVGLGPVEETVTNSRAGTVQAGQRAKLSPEIGGQVTALPFRAGERVEAGDVLLRLDARLHEARLDLAKRDLEAAQAQSHQSCLTAERAARELERTGRLAEDQIVSVDLLDKVESASQTTRAACQASQARVARARSAVALAQVELEKTTLRAPFDAIIADVSIEVGEWTTPSPPALPVPPVIDLLDPSSIYVSAPMDEVDSARIAAGQEVRVTVDSHPGKTLAGRVTRVAPYVLDLEAQNRTVEIDVELADRDLATTLLPGTSADVEVILQVLHDVVRLPTAALFEGTKVLVVEGERLEERSVEIGLKNWNFSQARSGLEVGDEVVLSLDQVEVQAGALAEVGEVVNSHGSPGL